jgi:hypothetical protein
VGVEGGGLEVAMPERDRNGADVGAGFEEVGGEAVAEGVGGDVLVEAGGPGGAGAEAADGGIGEGPDGDVAGEEPIGRAFGLPVEAEQVEEAWGEHDVAVLAALALAGADDHAFAVDDIDAEGGDLGDAEAVGIGGHEHGAVLDRSDGGEDARDLVLAEDDEEILGDLGAADAGHDALALEGDLVEEAEGGDGLVVIAPGDVAFLDEVEQIGANVIGAEGLGGALEVLGECGDSLGVDLDGLGGEVAEVHVLDHAEAKRCHDVLPC